MSLGPELAEGRAADQVRLQIEGAVNRGVGDEEPLGGALYEIGLTGDSILATRPYLETS